MYKYFKTTFTLFSKNNRNFIIPVCKIKNQFLINPKYIEIPFTTLQSFYRRIENHIYYNKKKTHYHIKPIVSLKFKISSVKPCKIISCTS